MAAPSSGTSPISTTSSAASSACDPAARRRDAPHILNIGNNRAEPVTKLVALLEQELQKSAVIQIVPKPAADVLETWASVDRLADLTGYAPTTPLEVGIPRFASWFKSYRQ